MTAVSPALLGDAAAGILARLGEAARGPVTVLYGESKRELAIALQMVLRRQGVQIELHEMAGAPSSSAGSPTGEPALRRAAEVGSLVILADLPQAPWLFATVGRPDRGVRFPTEHLYCDWLMPLPGLLRILGADYRAVQGWRERLLGALRGAARLHLATPGGTDLTLAPRRWRRMARYSRRPTRPPSRASWR